MAMVGSEDSSLEKDHGIRPRLGFDLGVKTRISPIVKRSYKRALRRASRDGMAWYRGRILTVQSHSQSSTDVSQSIRSTSMKTSSYPSRKHPRLTIFNWNAGGLAMHTWDSLQLWLKTLAVDIVMLQETHWQHDGEWFADNFLLHTFFDRPASTGGLLMMVAKHVASISNIAWQVLRPGRLLHIRLFGPQRNIDLINCYQYTCKSHRAADRSSLLQKLAEQLNNIPRRNLLYIGGDFNTTMAIQSEVVGVRSYRFQQQKQLGKIHQDWDELHSFCLRHHLIALNTWCMDSPPTFSSPTGHSRIDYIFARKQMMDCTSKQVHHLTDFPLLITNDNNHIPLVAEVPSKWIFNAAPRQRGWSKHARDNLYQGWKYDTPCWQLGTEALQKLVNFTHHLT